MQLKMNTQWVMVIVDFILTPTPSPISVISNRSPLATIIYNGTQILKLQQRDTNIIPSLDLRDLFTKELEGKEGKEGNQSTSISDIARYSSVGLTASLCRRQSTQQREYCILCYSFSLLQLSTSIAN